MSKRSEPSRGLPKDFSVAEKSCSLYEDIEYEQYWDDPAQARQDALEKRLISEMLPARGRRIIDVGCGYGRLAPVYIDRFDSVVLYDGSMSLLRHAREDIGERAVLVAGDAMNLPFRAASFDTLLTIRVLQHMTDLGGAIREMRRVLPRGGSFVFSYHNKRNARRVLAYPKTRQTADPFSLESAEVSPTLISHHPTRVAALLGDAGFTDAEYRGAVVVNGLAQLTEKFGRTEPSGLAWASFTGRHALAPWLVGRASAVGGGELAPGDSVEALFECPDCRGNVARSDESYRCGACGRSYPIVDGIADFRL